MPKRRHRVARHTVAITVRYPRDLIDRARSKEIRDFVARLHNMDDAAVADVLREVAIRGMCEIDRNMEET